MAAGVVAALLLALTRPEPVEASFPGTNGKIAFERNVNQIWLMYPTGVEQTKLVGAFGDNEFDPAYSPNGTKIAFTHHDDEIWVMSWNGTIPKRLTKNPLEGDSQPAWSPDGKQIAFTRDFDIWVMNRDGTGQKNLTNTPSSSEFAPAWSPNGLEIAYARGPCGNNTHGTCIYKMFANGFGQQPLVKAEDDSSCPEGGTILHSIFSEDPAWSPDGSKIAFSSDASCTNEGMNGGGGNIWVMNSDGSEKKDLNQDNGTNDYEPTWSPDGRKIAFVSDRDDYQGDIYVMDAEAEEPQSGLVRITRNEGFDEDPDWGVRPSKELEMVPQVPVVMRHFGWHNGARLQEKWFAGQPMVLGKDFQVKTHKDVLNAPKDTTTIKMDSWVLTFPRAKAAYDELVRERACTNTKAQDEIRKMLERQGKLQGKQRKPFGNLDAPVPNQDRDYVQQRSVVYSISEMRNPNDMAAALGRFNLRCLVAGQIVPHPNRPEYMVVIKELGVYVRDSYDFNGEQSLGFWRANPPYASALPALNVVELTNFYYRKWRSANGEGGDFLIFSNRKKVTLNTPFRFIIDCRAPRPCEVVPG